MPGQGVEVLPVTLPLVNLPPSCWLFLLLMEQEGPKIRRLVVVELREARCSATVTLTVAFYCQWTSTCKIHTLSLSSHSCWICRIWTYISLLSSCHSLVTNLIESVTSVISCPSVVPCNAIKLTKIRNIVKSYKNVASYPFLSRCYLLHVFGRHWGWCQ